MVNIIKEKANQLIIHSRRWSEIQPEQVLDCEIDGLDEFALFLTSFRKN
jgi:hypothetical protein